MKKGSLSLSVNAIVIFVIAFAMLGFGLFVIQKLQSTIDPKIGELLEKDNWQKSPNSDSPIEFNGPLVFQKGEKTAFAIGYYNTGTTSQRAIPAARLDCGNDLATGTGDSPNQVTLKSGPLNVGPSDWEPFAVVVEVGSGAAADIYVCNVHIVIPNSADNPTDFRTASNVLATKQVTVEIKS